MVQALQRLLLTTHLACLGRHVEKTSCILQIWERRGEVGVRFGEKHPNKMRTCFLPLDSNRSDPSLQNRTKSREGELHQIAWRFDKALAIPQTAPSLTAIIDIHSSPLHPEYPPLSFHVKLTSSSLVMPFLYLFIRHWTF